MISSAMPSALNWLLASRQCEITGLKNLLHTGEPSAALSQLIHELQRERGVSNIWLCSRGGLFGDELPNREQRVTEAIEAVMTTLPPLPQEKYYAEQRRLYSRIATALYALGELETLRRQVRHFQLSHADAMAHFNQIIRQLLTLGFEMIDSASEPGVSRALVAMFSFMQGKELAGQERAVGSAGYAAGAFTPAQSEQIMALIDAQERCFASFSCFADVDTLQQWRTMAAEEGETERLRRIACTRTAPDMAGTEMALRWYQLMTARIDRMKQLEDQLAQRLLQRCREGIRQAELQLDKQASLEQELAQNGGEVWDIYVTEQKWLKSEEPLETGGLTPHLGRYVLELVQEQAQRLQALDDELAAMRATLEDRKHIDRAKALLIRHHHLNEEQAWQTLRKMAMNQNRSMVDIAKALLSVAAIFPATPE